MTKEQEIRALEAFTSTLPQNTYLRPWLAAVLPEVRDALQQDILPQETIIGPAACYNALAKARAQANAIVADASKLAQEILDRAQEEAREFRCQSKAASAKKLREIADKLESLVW